MKYKVKCHARHKVKQQVKQLKSAVMVLLIIFFAFASFSVAEAENRNAPAASDAMIKSFLQEGFTYVDEREYKKAVKSFKRAAELAPNFSGTHYALGIGLKFLKDYDSAIVAHKTAISISPEFAEAHFELGLIHDITKNPVFSAEHFYWASIIFLNTNRRDEALQAYANLKRVEGAVLTERIFDRLYPMPGAGK